MAYPTISALPDTPNRQTDSSTEFSNKTDAFLGALENFREEVNDAGEYIDSTTDTVNTLVTDAETYIDGVVSNATDTIDNAVSDAEDYIDGVAADANDTINEFVLEAASYASAAEGSADNASDSAIDAASSADAAAGSSNWVGKWEDATGVGVKGTSYSYGDVFVYLLLVDLADVTSVKPSTDPNTWQLLNVSDQPNIDWDLEIPFNDSGAIIRGYGTHDQIDVSAAQDGSVMVDLPTKSVDVSRASSIGNINKSGVYEVLGDDVLPIGKDGAGIYDGYTCQPAYSEDFTTGSWSGVNCTLNSSSIELTSVSTFQLRKSFSFVSSQSYTVSVIVDSNDISSFQMRTTNAVSDGISIVDFDLTSESYILGSYATGATIDKRIDGYYEVSFSFTATSTVSDLIQFIRGSGEIGSVIGVTNPMVTDTSSKRPYMATEETAVTVATSIVTVPMENNFPASGESFTISIDCAGFPSVTDGSTRRIFHRDSASGGALSLRIDLDGLVRFYSRDLSGGFSGAIDGNTIEANKTYNWKIVYDGDLNYFYLYENGVLSGRSYSENPVWPTSGDIVIGAGSSGAASANTYFKNFKVVHRALTPAEIAAEGAPK